MHKFQKSKAAKLELLKYFAHWRPKETYSVLKQKALNSFSSVEFKRSALTKTMSTYVKQYITSSSDFRTMSSLGSILRKTPIVLLSTISSTYGTSISGVCTFVNQSWNRHHQRQIDTGPVSLASFTHLFSFNQVIHSLLCPTVCHITFFNQVI